MSSSEDQHPAEWSLRAELSGLRVSSVVFVEDYLQLILDGGLKGITVHAPPAIVSERDTIEFNDERFARLARELLGTEIVDASADGTRAVVVFSNGLQLVVPFSPGMVEPMLVRRLDGVVVLPDDAL